MSTSKIRSSTQLVIDAALDANSKQIQNLASPSLSTDAATKGYVDGILGTNDAMLYKGVIDASTNPNYPAADAGHTYKISVSGKVGGASGVTAAVGDLVICTADSTASGTQAAVGQYWDVIHVADGAGSVTSSAATPIDNQIARLDGATGTLIQNSLATIDDSGSINIPSGQAYKVNGTALVTNATHSGDVTGDTSLTIANGVVTNAKLANVATNTIKGRATAGTGAPEDLTASQVRSILNVADGADVTTAAGVASVVHGASTKTTPVDNDEVAMTDSVGSYGLIRVTWANIKATLKTYFDTLYKPNFTFVDGEAPTGTKNGTNPTFTLANTPASGSVHLFLNGQRLNAGAGNDYTISGATITMLTDKIPVSTDVMLADYRY